MSSPMVERFRKRIAERTTNSANTKNAGGNFLEQPHITSRTLDSNEISDNSRTERDLGPYHKIPGTLDKRLREISYSSLGTLHSCAKKYQLYKLRTTSSEDSFVQNISNAFGHSCGLATQLIFLENPPSLKNILWQQFLQWPQNIPIFEEDNKAKKGFWYALICTLKLWHARNSGFLQDWSIISYNGKPAVELSFEITLPHNFRYRGFVDAVIRNKDTGAIGVLERKTTKSNTPDPAMYKNSGQAIGYSIVLDHIFPELSSYDVLYLVYSSTSMEETVFSFTKSFSQRAEWIQEILFDIGNIVQYDEAQVFPRNGNACFDFFRQCQYFQTCTMSIGRLAKEYHESMSDNTKYDISVTLEQLIESQLRGHSSGAPK